MEELTVISIEEFCKHYNVPLSFIKALEEVELVEIVSSETDDPISFIHISHLKHVEMLIRLHFELEINVAGLDVVNNLLKQIRELQQENLELRNRLGFFE